MKTKLTWLTDVTCPWCRRRARAKQESVRFRRLCSQSTCFAFRILESASSTREADGTGGLSSTQKNGRQGKVRSMQERPRTAALTEEETVTRAKVLKQVFEVHFKGFIDMAKMILTKTGFLNAWTRLTDGMRKEDLKEWTDTTGVRLEEGWPRACGSSQKQLFVTVVFTRILSWTRNNFK